MTQLWTTVEVSVIRYVERHTTIDSWAFSVFFFWKLIRNPGLLFLQWNTGPEWVSDRIGLCPSAFHLKNTKTWIVSFGNKGNRPMRTRKQPQAQKTSMIRSRLFFLDMILIGWNWSTTNCCVNQSEGAVKQNSQCDLVIRSSAQLKIIQNPAIIITREKMRNIVQNWSFKHLAELVSLGLGSDLSWKLNFVFHSVEWSSKI